MRTEKKAYMVERNKLKILTCKPKSYDRVTIITEKLTEAPAIMEDKVTFFFKNKILKSKHMMRMILLEEVEGQHHSTEC